MPKVSVILPFYNAEKTLEHAIISIINQSLLDFELILVNNDSTDSSKEIAKKYAAKDKRLILLDEQQKGVVFAHNKGLLVAGGEYIARMDADDFSHPKRLEKQVEVLENKPEIGLVSSLVKYVGELRNEGMKLYVDWVNETLSHKQIAVNRFVESPVINPSIMFRKSVVESFGSYRDGDFPEDYELILRYLENGVQFYKISENLIEWNDSYARLTRTDKRYSVKAFYRIKTEYLYNWLKLNNPSHPHVVVWGAGNKSVQRFFMLQQKGVECDFFIDVVENKRHNTIHYMDTPEPGKHFILSYVGNRGKRQEIKAFLESRNYIEGKDFLAIS